MNQVVKFAILPIVLTIIFNFLEYGLIWDRADKFIYPILLALATILNFYQPILRRYCLILSISLLVLMSLLYLIGQQGLSSLAGSIGLALFVTLVISYFPAILKRGYIERV